MTNVFREFPLILLATMHASCVRHQLTASTVPVGHYFKCVTVTASNIIA